MISEIAKYNEKQESEDKQICDLLAITIDNVLMESESKIWHAHPVWFIHENPIVGYSKQKQGLRLMFWSGADFKDEALNYRGKKFKDASIFYHSVSEVDIKKVENWLEMSKEIQWDYKNIVKRKGILHRI